MEEPADLLSEPAPSLGEKGKRMAESPELSLTKQPSVKKLYAAGTCSPTTDSSPTLTLAAYPTTENPASEHSLSNAPLTAD